MPVCQIAWQDTYAVGMASEPRASSTDEHIRRVVDMLLRREGRQHRHLAEMLGTTRQTATNKIRGATRFRVDELEVLARTFAVEIAVFFDPTRPLSTTPVLPPVPDPDPGLVLCTKEQLGLLVGKIAARYGYAAKSALIQLRPAA